MKRVTFLWILVVFTTTFSLGTFAGESHYRWTDKFGNPVHSDRPPPRGVDYEVISSGSSLVRKVKADEGVVPAEIEPSFGNQFEQVETDPEEEKKNAEYCSRAQDNLDTLNTTARIRMRNDQGELRFLSEEDKEAQRERARDLIAAHCK